jgi:hypothetical protein
MKGAALIVFALFIDGVQAAISASLVVVAAFPGTIAGSAAGCWAGSKILGDVGCAVGGFVLGLLGSIPVINGALAVVSEPIGLMLGFAIGVCISCTFGAALVLLLLFNGTFYPKYLAPGGIVELIPGFEVLPSWTAMTVACVLQKNKDVKNARALIAKGLQSVMKADLGPNSYIQKGGNAVTHRYAPDSPAKATNSADDYIQPKSRMDGIRAPLAPTPRNDTLRPLNP